MPNYLHPGVYIEEIPSTSRPIEGVGTSTALFMGLAPKGEMEQPKRITSFDEYQRIFGGIRNSDDGDPLGISVLAFFQNGGRAAYIVRLADNAKKSKAIIKYTNDNTTEDTNDNTKEDTNDNTIVVEFEAASEGKWGDDLIVILKPDDLDPEMCQLTVGEVIKGLDGEPEKEGDEIKIIPREHFTGLSLKETGKEYSLDNLQSELITIKILGPEEYYLGTSKSKGSLEGFKVTDLNSKTLKLEFDGGGYSRKVEFSKDEFNEDSKLEDVAGKIQEIVRNGAKEGNPRMDFTAKLTEESELILTSGTRTKGSSVKAVPLKDDSGTDDKDNDASILLELGEHAGGIEKTGAQTFTEFVSKLNKLNKHGQAQLKDGSDGGKVGPGHYKGIFDDKLREYPDINIICLPEQQAVVMNDGEYSKNVAVDAAIAHAEYMKNCMVIIDPPKDATLSNPKEVKDLQLQTSDFAVLYYPWVEVANPLFKADSKSKPKSFVIPPCGFAAGIWAKTDAKRGVWKAPAGVENQILGVRKLAHYVVDDVQDTLNPLGINCLRSLPGYGPVVWGARTRATQSKPEWRYVSVRRTALFIEESIYNSIQWAVFEPNNELLWSSLRHNIGSFMNGLFRAGAFQGAKVSDAYFVRCGFGQTMTDGDIERGQVVVIVGFAPLRPAEFVVVRIQQKVGQS